MEGNSPESPLDTQSVKAQVLAEAAAIVTKDRNQSYGPAEDNFRNIARLWNVYLNSGPTFVLEPHHVADMMILMKVARNMHKFKRDNYVDIAGYAACGAEAAGL